MYRFLAGAAACFLLLTGAFLIWQSRAQQGPGLPAAPEPRSAGPLLARGTLEAPEASPKSREERRFPPQGFRQARHQRQWGAVVRGMGGQDHPEVPGRGQGPQRLADRGRICDHGAASAQAPAVQLLGRRGFVAAAD